MSMTTNFELFLRVRLKDGTDATRSYITKQTMPRIHNETTEPITITVMADPN